MDRGARGGFSLVEGVFAMAVAGVGLGGLAGLMSACVRSAGEVNLRMTARMLALSALEADAPVQGPAPLAVVLHRTSGRREARVSWEEGGRRRVLRLGAGHG